MAHGKALTVTEVATFRPKVGSCPKEYRDLCNVVIDQGWTFEESSVSGGKHKLIPPDGDRSKTVGVPRTPSSYGSFYAMVGALRRAGAEIDGNGKSTREKKRPRTISAASDADIMAAFSDREHIDSISTQGAWWRPDYEPEPEPEPAPAPVVVERPVPSRAFTALLERSSVATAPRSQEPTTPPSVVHPDDAQGTVYTLTQAQAMLRQGYHVNKVISRTGWGRNWFADMVDHTGYLTSAMS